MQPGSYAFISYSSKDKNAADFFRHTLQKEKISCWMAPYDIPVGASYASAIVDAIENCGCLVLILSETSQQSSYILREVDAALSWKKPIIPIQIEQMQLNNDIKFYVGINQIIEWWKDQKDSKVISLILCSVKKVMLQRALHPDHQFATAPQKQEIQTNDLYSKEKKVQHSPKRLKPYEGSEAFIFISYSHKDNEHIMPIIERLMADGYRVWYDDAIHPAEEFIEYIADKILSCDLFIAFMSQNYLDSEYCQDELFFAREKKKNQFMVYLDNLALPDGMHMRFGRLQAVHKYRYTSEADFYEKFYTARNIDQCR